MKKKAHSQTKNRRTLPLDEVRFVEVHVEPWPDGRRLRVHITLTPFTTPPNLQATLLNEQDEEIASANIIETVVERLVFTMHIPAQAVGSQYKLAADLMYPDLGVVDHRMVTFEISGSSPSND
jgi:hypothetical protein